MTSVFRSIGARGEVFALYLPASQWQPGLNFMTRDADFVQVGTWGYTAGTRLGPHAHNEVKREAARTQEVVFVRAGRIRAHVFDRDDSHVESIEMTAGDVLVLLGGGHGYEILVDGTQVLEVKNGPYPGPEADRRRFPWSDGAKR